MLGNEDFEKLFNQILSKSFLLNPNNFEKKTYLSEDGSMSFTYITTKGNRQNESDELSQLKQKLDLAVEEQKFEDAVVGREQEILRIAQILSRRKKNNPIIIGEPGCVLEDTWIEVEKISDVDTHNIEII